MPHVIGLVSRTGQPQLQHPARQAERQRIGHDRHLLPEPANGMQVVQSGTDLYRSRFILDKETSGKKLPSRSEVVTLPETTTLRLPVTDTGSPL